MQLITKKLASYLMVCVLTMTSLSLPMVASAASYGYMSDGNQPTGGKMMADAFLVRPFMLVGTVLTTATFIITLPFSALGGNVGESAKTLVAEPAAYTFTRPMGEL
ncbi:MAG: hypothetical protein BMS9Abin06_1045 [Gammaproteobacteria bacterium]|nr:MAG: hypothetical protein BMS9Abin06_1045 [Gammaproteobacteria bacterium]